MDSGNGWRGISPSLAVVAPSTASTSIERGTVHSHLERIRSFLVVETGRIHNRRECVASVPWNGYLALRRQHENRLSLYHEKWTNEWGQVSLRPVPAWVFFLTPT